MLQYANAFDERLMSLSKSYSDNASYGVQGLGGSPKQSSESWVGVPSAEHRQVGFWPKEVQTEASQKKEAQEFLEDKYGVHGAHSRNEYSHHALDNGSMWVGPEEILSRLPDDEDQLFAGLVDELDRCTQGLLVDDGEGGTESSGCADDCDLFYSSGGMDLGEGEESGRGTDLECDPSMPGQVANAWAGEHPLGEHPSRTLFVRNINSNVDDSELRLLFEQYGSIRTLYTACKHRGFVMISYFDIRAARSAMRSLQAKPLRRRKLDIHFSIPKDNPSDKDMNQGTLVVFNLDASVTNEDLKQIFGVYGEVKEIRETPNKRHHKFIEFYDIRAAESALRSLNRSDIAGKRIKLEPSRPGGTHRNLLHASGSEGDFDEASLGHQLSLSPPAPRSPWGLRQLAAAGSASWQVSASPPSPSNLQAGSPMRLSTSWTSDALFDGRDTLVNSESSRLFPAAASHNPISSSSLPDLTATSASPSGVASSSLAFARDEVSGKGAQIPRPSSHSPLSSSLPHSLPEYGSSLLSQTLFRPRQAASPSPASRAHMAPTFTPGGAAEFAFHHGTRGGSSLSLSTAGTAYEYATSGLANCSSGSPLSEGALSGSSIWSSSHTAAGSSPPVKQPALPRSSSATLPQPSPGGGMIAPHKHLLNSYSSSGSSMNPHNFHGSSQHHPLAGSDPLFVRGSYSLLGESMDAPLGGSLGASAGYILANGMRMARPGLARSTSVCGSEKRGGLIGMVRSGIDSDTSLRAGVMGGLSPSLDKIPYPLHLDGKDGSSQMRSRAGGGSCSSTNSFEGGERSFKAQNRRPDVQPGHGDNARWQFQLDLQKIMRGEDVRTTLMIKNIPNKYTQKMLLAAIDDLYRGLYDFFYLPIDFKNKCNVGYAFINMVSPLTIVPFYKDFNGKKWEKFNSEKVANLAYARIQGRNALVAHFQNSSLMNEDKRCRPILFHSDGTIAGDQEPFPVGMVGLRARSIRDRQASMSSSSLGFASSPNTSWEDPSHMGSHFSPSSPSVQEQVAYI